MNNWSTRKSSRFLWKNCTQLNPKHTLKKKRSSAQKLDSASTWRCFRVGSLSSGESFVSPVPNVPSQKNNFSCLTEVVCLPRIKWCFYWKHPKNVVFLNLSSKTRRICSESWGQIYISTAQKIKMSQLRRSRPSGSPFPSDGPAAPPASCCQGRAGHGNRPPEKVNFVRFFRGSLVCNLCKKEIFMVYNVCLWCLWRCFW